MNELQMRRGVADVHADLERLVDELNTIDLTLCSSHEVLDALRAHEVHARRVAHASYRLINEARDRNLPDEYGCPSMGRLLSPLLRLDPREANARDRAAVAAGQTRSLTGQSLPPPFAHVADAQAAGVVSERHALLIEKTIDRLSDSVSAECRDEIEAELIGHAAHFDPAQLGVVARRIAEHYDPDGAVPDERERERRAIGISTRPDGWSRMEGWLSPELSERWHTVLDTYAAPRPALDGVKDTRTAAQRAHDGTLAALDTLIRVGDVPTNNGVSCTVVVTMTTEQYESRTGLARTGHGRLVPAGEARDWGAGDTSVLAVALNSMRAVSHYGHTHRIFTESQRRAIATRDRGCTFPGCPEPPARCQVDHVIRHEHGGPTSVDNGQLLCRYNHREHQRQGWSATMIDGVPHWIPPAVVDPVRQPRRNTLHDTDLRGDPGDPGGSRAP